MIIFSGADEHGNRFTINVSMATVMECFTQSTARGTIVTLNTQQKSFSIFAGEKSDCNVIVDGMSHLLKSYMEMPTKERVEGTPDLIDIPVWLEELKTVKHATQSVYRATDEYLCKPEMLLDADGDVQLDKLTEYLNMVCKIEKSAKFVWLVTPEFFNKLKELLSETLRQIGLEPSEATELYWEDMRTTFKPVSNSSDALVTVYREGNPIPIGIIQQEESTG